VVGVVILLAIVLAVMAVAFKAVEAVVVRMVELSRLAGVHITVHLFKAIKKIEGF
jgi:hypothetical protein